VYLFRSPKANYKVSTSETMKQNKTYRHK
jgi:hypothetical protein